jgi:hypothetical protein
MHDQVVMKPDSDTSGAKRGAIAVVPPRVLRNWTTNAPGGLAIMKLSEFSRDLTDKPEEARALERRFETAAAMIVDECHRMNAR